MLKNINKNEFEKEVLNATKPILVDFYATWCGPCKMLAPILEKIAISQTDFDIIKINIDDDQELAYKYGIDVVPTMLFFKNGEMIEKIEGYVDENTIISKMSKYL